MTSPEPPAPSPRHRAAGPGGIPVDAVIRQALARSSDDEPAPSEVAPPEPEHPRPSTLLSTVALVLLGLIGVAGIALIVLTEAGVLN